MTTLCALSPASIASSVSRALREELETFPKPGLVSLVDNGSHPDMDARCFLDSITAITPSFALMAEAAAHGASLPDLQRIGLSAEHLMLSATAGRNTHRGAIFCLGLLAAAAGCRHLDPSPSLGGIVRSRWGASIPQASSLPPASAGISICRSLGIGGVRHEAALGFPTVYRHGLPAFRAALAHGRPAARVQAFFTLLEHCEDTTLLHRGGTSGRDFARGEARRFLRGGGVADPRWRHAAGEIHRAFIHRNLTAGGAADLLAAVLFIEDISSLT